MKEPLKIEHDVIYNGTNHSSSVNVLKTLQKIVERINELEEEVAGKIGDEDY